MAKNIKTRKGADGNYYPYTSPDIVIDANGKSVTTKFNELETKIDSSTSIDDANTAENKTWSSSKISSQFKDIAHLKSKIEILEEDPKQEDLYEGRMWIYSPVTYKVTNNLTNCVSSNKDTSVLKNSSYNATITPNSNYDLGAVIVTMGGVDITSTCVSNGIITITSVTGDIVITCTAVSNLKPCTGITLSVNTLTFTTTDTQTLTATVTPSDTTDKIVWSVSPTGIANVNNGIVTPITNGSCVITATCGSKSATCNVAVKGIDTSNLGLKLNLRGSDFTNDPQTTILTDNSGNSNNATVSGFSYTEISGSDGNGNIVFDGIDDKLTINGSDSMSITNNEFTVVFKGSINDLSQTQKYVSECLLVSSVNEPQISLIYGYVNNTLELYGGANLNIRTGTQITISDTNEHIFVYTFGNNKITCYLDGTQINQVVNNVAIPSGNVVTIIGGSKNSNENCNISMNYYLFYNRCLTSEEVQSLN